MAKNNKYKSGGNKRLALRSGSRKSKSYYLPNVYIGRQTLGAKTVKSINTLINASPHARRSKEILKAWKKVVARMNKLIAEGYDFDTPEFRDIYMGVTIKNLHRGNNKINWTRTISHTQAFVQDADVVYTTPVNKKRIVNYEEELFVIFYSILNYLNEIYGFHTPINIQYDLIRGKQFRQYMNGMGKTRLMQIKYIITSKLCISFSAASCCSGVIFGIPGISFIKPPSEPSLLTCFI